MLNKNRSQFNSRQFSFSRELDDDSALEPNIAFEKLGIIFRFLHYRKFRGLYIFSFILLVIPLCVFFSYKIWWWNFKNLFLFLDNLKTFIQIVSFLLYLFLNKGKSLYNYKLSFVCKNRCIYFLFFFKTERVLEDYLKKNW